MEMLVVCCIIGVIVGISVPSISAGLDSVRISTAGDSVASFLNAAVNRAERRQVAVEVVIWPKDGLLQMFSTEHGAQRELKLPLGVLIEGVQPEGGEDVDGVRRIVFMPGGTVEGIGIQLGNRHGTHRIIRLDPMTGFPHVESVDIR
jgi:hypothetical protein